MATETRYIKTHIKKRLIADSGNKCANPGCSNIRPEIHHIKLWSVYKSHSTDHMIAVCPSCHDACHHGKLLIDEDTLYRWKGITKQNDQESTYGHVYVEPNTNSKILLGSISIAQKIESNTKIIDFSNENRLSFSVTDNWLSVSATLKNNYGKTILKITDNNIKINKDSNIYIEQRPGKFRVTAPTSNYFLPAPSLYQIRKSLPDFGESGTLTILDIEVLKPGLIKMEGIWPSRNSAIVITSDALYFCDPSSERAGCWVGEGEDTVLIYSGPASKALFQISER